jgi:hypothetical protein
MKNILPHTCPSCQATLDVKTLVCSSCHTEVSGAFELPLLASISKQEQEFVISFVKNSGSLKQMALELGLSYPTVRNLLDDLIEKIEQLQKTSRTASK